MRHLKTTLAVLGAATILVLAGNTVALATTGHSFILGKANSANKMTSLTRTTAGPALKVNTKSSSNPPLVTNGKGKVANLNADAVDGLDGASLQTRSYVFTRAVTVATTGFSMPITVPTGKYLVSYSAFLAGATSTTVGCYIARANPTQFVGESRFTSGSATPGLTGSGYVEVNTATTSTVTLNCSSGVAFTTFAAEPIQVVMTRVDTASTAAARLAAPSARAH